MSIFGRLFRRSGPRNSAPYRPRDPTNEIVSVDSVGEEHRYLEQHPCACGGTWTIAQRTTEGLPGFYLLDKFLVQCERCRTLRQFVFGVNVRSQLYQAEAAAARVAFTTEINPDEAEKLLRKVLALDPGNEMALAQLSHLEARRRNK